MNSAAQRFGSGRAGGNVMRALAVLGIVALLAAPTAYFHYAWTSAEREMLETARADAEFLRERLLKQDVRARSSSADATDADEGGSSTARSISALLQQLPPMEFEGRQLVRDANGVILAQRGGVPHGPVFSVTTPLRGVPALRADVEIIRSSKPLLWHMLGVGSLVLVLGASIALVAVQGYRRTRGQGREVARVSGLAEQGVLDRNAFIEGVRDALVRSERDGTECTLFHLDLDHFKMVNGAVGQSCADLLLEQVAKVIRVRIDALAHEADLPPVLMGTPGGDVFLLLVQAMPRSAPVTEAFARGVLDALGNAFEVGPYQLYLSASVGASPRAGRAITAEKLIREAELAKIFAKNQGSGSYAIHDQNMDVQAEARDELGQALRRALANEEFLLYYQPKVHTVTGVVTGVEALLRWQPEGKPMVMPDQFIPALEETGLIVPAGAWVLREACNQVMTWRARGLPPVSVAVNVSARLRGHGGRHPEGNGPGGALPGAGADRDHLCGQRRRQRAHVAPPGGHGGEPGHRRFRYRPFVAELSEQLQPAHTEDRPFVPVGGWRRVRQHCHCTRHHCAGPWHGHVCGGRGRRDRGAGRFPAWLRLPASRAS